MGFIAFGVVIFILGYLFTPVLDWTKQMYSNGIDLVGNTQLELYRSMPDKPYRGLAMGLGSILAGFFLGLATIVWGGWASITYLDDGILKAILAISFFIAFLITPIIFAVQARVTVDNWFRFKKEIEL